MIVAATSAAFTALGSITDRETPISTSAIDIGMNVRAVIKVQEAAWNRGDIDGYMNGYAHSGKTIFVSGDKVTRGWQTVRDRYKKKQHPRKDGRPHPLRTRSHAIEWRGSVGFGSLVAKTQSRQPARTIYAAIPTDSGRLAYRARPYVGGGKVAHASGLRSVRSQVGRFCYILSRASSFS